MHWLGKTWTVAFAAATAGLIATSGTAAKADEVGGTTPAAAASKAGDAGAPTQRELQMQAQMNAMQRQLDALKGEQARQNADATAAIQHVLADADAHSKMLDVTGFAGGYDPKRGFYLQSDDGQTLFHPNFYAQFRYAADFARGGKADGSYNDPNGFEFRRLRPGADGTIFSKDLAYNIILDVDRHNGAVTLFEANLKVHIPSSSFYVLFGQFRDPVVHESIVASRRQLDMDRTYLVDRLANADNIVQGISGVYENKGPLRAEVAYTDGTGSSNTNFQDQTESYFPASVPAVDFGVAGRVDYRLLGTGWGEYGQFSALGATEDLLVVGAGGDWTEANAQDFYTHTADVQFDGVNGLGLYAAYLGRYRDAGGGGTRAGSSYDYGFEAQASYLFGKWEPYVRYDYTHFDSHDNSPFAVPAGANANVHEITGGVNYYFKGFNARFTLDASYFPNGVPFSDDGAGVIANKNADEFVVKGQFQLLI